jgi:hypothetical protein
MNQNSAIFIAFATMYLQIILDGARTGCLGTSIPSVLSRKVILHTHAWKLLKRISRASTKGFNLTCPNLEKETRGDLRIFVNLSNSSGGVHSWDQAAHPAHVSNARSAAMINQNPCLTHSISSHMRWTRSQMNMISFLMNASLTATFLQHMHTAPTH